MTNKDNNKLCIFKEFIKIMGKVNFKNIIPILKLVRQNRKKRKINKKNNKQEIEEMIKQEENRNRATGMCSCGYMLKAKDRFCPNCGKGALSQGKNCVCGAQVEINSKFCHIIDIICSVLCI